MILDFSAAGAAIVVFSEDLDEIASLSECFFFFQAEDGIRDLTVTGVQTCALPISAAWRDPARATPSGHATRRTPPRGAPLSPRRAAAARPPQSARPARRAAARDHEIGRASCRERV